MQASGETGHPALCAPEQDGDLQDDKQEFEDHADGDKDYPVEENIEGDVTNLTGRNTGRKKKLWELRNKMVPDSNFSR